MELDIAHLRKEYRLSRLSEAEVDPNPFRQFNMWMEQAMTAHEGEANAMALATVHQGQPSIRIVLLKGVDQRGFIFYTNYESRKGRELADNPLAAINFFWQDLERQVRIEGMVEKLAADASDAYFNQRDKGSRIGAWASPQSEVIPSRDYLEARVASIQHKFESDEEVPRPSHWGGYRLVPHYFEFWQGRASRLHDRLSYTLDPRTGQRWNLNRLAP